MTAPRDELDTWIRSSLRKEAQTARSRRELRGAGVLRTITRCAVSLPLHASPDPRGL